MTSHKPRLWSLLALLLAVLVAAFWARRAKPASSRSAPAAASAERAAEEQARAYLALEAREQAADQTTWAPELDAERHEDEFVRLWDALNGASDKWGPLRGLAFDELVLPPFLPEADLAQGIRRWRARSADGSRVAAADWQATVSRWAAEDWVPRRTSWHLTRHTPGAGTLPARSVVELTARLENPGRIERAVLRATVEVAWAAVPAGAPPRPARLAVREAELLARTGPPPFTPWLDAPITTGFAEFTDPLIAADLDGDGLSELLMVGANRVWWNRPARGGEPRAPRQFVPDPLAVLPPDRVVAAALGDVDGDGRADLLAGGGQGLAWFAGEATGGFPGQVRPGWSAAQPLRHPQVLALGDVDGDGDLDAWLAQYKLPYQGGQFPTPYFDANDGFPSHLLLNDGHGRFTEGTAGSGLEGKRFRRTYSASFIDLDSDGDQDLVNVSDFAGADVFLNDGRGKFTDVTDRLGEARHAFGMAHVLNDHDGDGRPDLLVLGMGSSTAERMDALGLGRAEWPAHTAKRAPMTFGNRLFLGSPAGLLPAPAPLARALARTGWTWGAAWADFDNDRDLDLVAANGHETRASTRDHERQFWRHDLYAAGSTNTAAADLYFRTASGRRQADAASYGGWQDNAFLLNSGGADFAEAAWLLGVAVPEDGRNLITDDLDGDGRLDLVATTFETWPQRRQRLLVFHNELVAPGGWIGFRLDGGGRWPVGARVELVDTAGRQTRWIVAGDSFRSQSAAAAHFGLGTNTVLQAAIIWPDGRRMELAAPAAGRWHRLAPPK